MFERTRFWWLCIILFSIIIFIMIQNWSEKFISSEIADNIICLENSDHHECERYTVSLQNKNYKNNFNAAQDKIFQISNQNSLLISSVYINVNEKWVDSNLWLIDALLKVMISKSFHVDETASASDESVHIQKDLLIIFYAICDQTILISI